jgi:pimeloyl-ACP methyl ester carboxylesterase
MLTEAIVRTPYQLQPFSQTREVWESPYQALGVRERFRVSVRNGEPAEIAVSIIDPPNLWEEPRGTVLVLHGIRAAGIWMIPIGARFAEAGYRVAIVDLRGHGGSSGETLTYGVRESQDLVQVIDELAARGLVAGPIGVFGHSYGAATAIQLAAIDPRIEAIVAAAPFADLRDEVPHYVRTVLPGVGHLISTEHFNAVLDAAGRIGQFDPDAASAEVAVTRTSAPILLMHGLNDLVIPPDHSLRIYGAAEQPARLVFLPGTGHFGVWWDAQGEVSRQSLAWLDEHLESSESTADPNAHDDAGATRPR